MGRPFLFTFTIPSCATQSTATGTSAVRCTFSDLLYPRNNSRTKYAC